MLPSPARLLSGASPAGLRCIHTALHPFCRRTLAVCSEPDKTGLQAGLPGGSRDPIDCSTIWRHWPCSAGSWQPTGHHHCSTRPPDSGNGCSTRHSWWLLPSSSAAYARPVPVISSASASSVQRSRSPARWSPADATHRVRHPLYFYSTLFLVLNPVMTVQWLLLTRLFRGIFHYWRVDRGTPASAGVR